MTRAALLGLLLTAACGGQAEGSEQAPVPASVDGGAGDEAVELGLRTAVSLELDCSRTGGARLDELFVRVEDERAGRVIEGRLSGDLCARHDVALEPAAPALGLLCPDWSPIGDSDCFDLVLTVTLCSPGFRHKTSTLYHGMYCQALVGEAPRCDDLSERRTSLYPFEPVVYAPEPWMYDECYSFSEPPAGAVEDSEDFSFFECPCNP